ncbi:hypothetical protein C0995_001094 [Termitomyces sp. Mi166|nr:hypothetical protein C0995_001094 [Termitomyces sp. Mi166\
MAPLVPLSALPVAPPSQLLIHRLTPDPRAPSVSAFRSSTPSLQRRARLLAPQAHFAFVNPFPVPFPYDIQPPGPDDPPLTDKSAYVESWLAAREAVHERPSNSNAVLRIHDPKLRETPRVLLGVAETALRDCLPNLDVGDAFSLLGTPSLSDQSPNKSGSTSPEAVSARQELVDILSGYSVLSTPKSNDDDTAFAPWSLRYSGHQFGTWAGQLGDGRAISIREHFFLFVFLGSLSQVVTPHPSDPSQTIELQLKGAGRTPFSRTADGLAVLRSSIREYLCSEAMHALRIPTTRALSLISLPSLPVHRERTESACVLTRLAPSFIRIGNFEAMNGPTNMFFFGGGQQEPDWDGLRVLGEWVAENVLKLRVKKGDPWGRELVLEVARRHARMVAAWQAYGFMHGVINTDNVSILGLTIDYGVFPKVSQFIQEADVSKVHMLSWTYLIHSTYVITLTKLAATRTNIYALRALLTSLAPLIGSELQTGRAVHAGWASSKSPADIDALRLLGMSLKDELDRVAQEETAIEYGRLMRLRLGLRFVDERDESGVFGPLVGVVQGQGLDWNGTFRTLCEFRSRFLSEGEGEGKGEMMDAFVRRLVEFSEPGEGVKEWERKREEWVRWLGVYAKRIGRKEERALWGGEEVEEEERERAMKGVNPRFVLRQWVLEEVIRRVEEDAEVGRRVLGKVMQMATNPFEPWGAEGDTRGEEELGKEEREERRFCGMGERRMLGFQCSCSS